MMDVTGLTKLDHKPGNRLVHSEDVLLTPHTIQLSKSTEDEETSRKPRKI
jgi:hypothetical protein